ncbi:hypothetical protein B0H11DRAFT_1943457 [Mycena galericulata]|nr:hypothetical protein B0H11DRAFT_1943457 [Mycena galericulata]
MQQMGRVRYPAETWHIAVVHGEGTGQGCTWRSKQSGRTVAPVTRQKRVEWSSRNAHEAGWSSAQGEATRGGRVKAEPRDRNREDNDVEALLTYSWNDEDGTGKSAKEGANEEGRTRRRKQKRV